jgi:hypothetical protein
MIPLAFLLACGGDDSVDTAPIVRPCVDPSATIVSPTADLRVYVGDTLALTGEAEGRGPFLYLWAIDRDVVTRGREAMWTPTAAGTFELMLQVEDDCGQGQALMDLVVEERNGR